MKCYFLREAKLFIPQLINTSIHTKGNMQLNSPYTTCWIQWTLTLVTGWSYENRIYLNIILNDIFILGSGWIGYCKVSRSVEWSNVDIEFTSCHFTWHDHPKICIHTIILRNLWEIILIILAYPNFLSH